MGSMVTVDGGGSTWTRLDRPTGRLRREWVTEHPERRRRHRYDRHIAYGYDYSDTYPSETGVVTVDGSGSKWTNSSATASLYVGYFGQGTLNVQGGGTVSCSSSGSNSKSYLAYT